MTRIAKLLSFVTALGLLLFCFTGASVPGAAGFQDHNIAVEDLITKQLEQQFAPLFRQSYRAELHFMRMVCKPTKAQFDKIAADSEGVLAGTTRNFALRLRDHKMRLTRTPAKPSATPPPSIADAIAKSVRKVLSPEQASRFQKELGLRMEAQKRAGVANLVAKADEALFLTAEQRRQLGTILTDHWNESVNKPEIYMGVTLDFPPMPDKEISAILTQSQKSVWSRISKGNGFVGLNINFMRGIELADEVWDEGKEALANPKRMSDRPTSKGPAASKGMDKR